jgi:hypothetical protein
MARDTIFENQTKEMPSGDEVVRSAQVYSDTYKMARLPGMVHEPGRGVVSTERPRRGHDY